MKSSKKVIHIVKHIPTGAEVPVIVHKVNDKNIIEKYSEFTQDRKAFTLMMLQNIWNKCRDDVLEILDEYQIPAHVKHGEIQLLNGRQSPADVAYFFEEYIIAVEKKAKISHSKLKPKIINSPTEH